MSIPPPGPEPAEHASFPLVPVTSSSAARTGASALAQLVGAATFTALIASWVAIGASLAAAIGGALAICVALPIVGWFFGLPIVLGLGMMTAAGWALGLALLVSAWALAAVTVGVIGLVAATRKTR
jgi:hypothetical protein